MVYKCIHIFTFESFFSIFTVTLHFSPLPSQTHHERRDHRDITCPQATKLKLDKKLKDKSKIEHRNYENECVCPLSGLCFIWTESRYYVSTGCPKKNALLSLKAYNSGLEATIGTSRDSFGILRLSAFI